MFQDPTGSATQMSRVPVFPLEQAIDHSAPYTKLGIYLPLVSHELKIENELIGLRQGGSVTTFLIHIWKLKKMRTTSTMLKVLSREKFLYV